MRSTDLGVVPESGNCSKIVSDLTSLFSFLVAQHEFSSRLVGCRFGLLVGHFGICTCLSDVQIMSSGKNKFED
jgi:hypothetical protein